MKYIKNIARKYFVDPIGRSIDINPSYITLLSVVVMAAAGYYLIYGNIVYAGALVLLSGYLDMLDGSIARNNKKETKFGMFFDRVADRISDAIIVCSIIIANYVDLWLGLAILSITLIASYISACLESQKKSRIGESLSWRGIRLAVLIIGMFTNTIYYAFLIFGIISLYNFLNRLYVALK